jgi:N-acyl-D-amino-acid deacylase
VFDLLIRNGTIIDGSGGKPFRSDLGVRQGRIAALNLLSEAKAGCVIDATGLVVSPGFIDMHSHDDLALIVEPLMEAKIRQGVTTDVIGHCGLGPAPFQMDEAWRNYLGPILGDGPDKWDWSTFNEYLQRLEAAQPALNIAPMVSYGAIRTVVCGMDRSESTEREQAAMANLVREALVEGAFGMSTGLVYVPCIHANQRELKELFQLVGEAGRLMDIHIRSHGSGLLNSVQEALDIAASAGVTLEISHLKSLGRPNWPNRPLMTAMIDEALARGQQIAFDQYPYSAGSTLLSHILPPWSKAGGGGALARRLGDPATRQIIREEALGLKLPKEPQGWECWVSFMPWSDVLISGARSPEVVGKTLSELGDEQGKEPIDAMLDLLAEDEGEVAAVYKNLFSEEDIAALMQHSASLVGTDGIITSGQPHPRLYGTYPRMLGKYCREEKVLDLPTVVKHMSSAPAIQLGLQDRGRLQVGMVADVVVFDPTTVSDTATYSNPRQFPVGIPHVIVNGVPVVQGGEITGDRPGKVLRA